MRLPKVQERLSYSSILAHEYVVSTITAEIRNINNIVYHRGYLYVAAENWLLKVNEKSLEIEQSVQFGPVYDSPWCRYYPLEECSIDNTGYKSIKTLTNNYNKLLLIYKKLDAILMCWSVRQGVCELRDMSNLSKIVQESSIPTVSNDQFNSTVGFIASSANKQDLLYVAATYNNQGPYRGDVPALAGRSLSASANARPITMYISSARRFMDVLSSQAGLKSSKASIQFISRFQKNFIVKYVEAFNLGKQLHF